MPFDIPPGQVLSSVPSSSNRRKTSRLGGCATVLFQIFHGKRLFPRKSLPAERPNQAASNHTDDKLPIAKLLLIADENRGGSFDDVDEEIEVEKVAEVEPCEEKVPRRVPGVVARLMGLETMPSPEHVCGERKQYEPCKNTDCQFSAAQQDRRTSTEVSSSLHRAKTKEFKTDLPAKFAARRRAKIQDDIAKSKVLAKTPSLPPHHLDSSFPSVMSSAKRESFNKSSIQTHKATHLLEAAAKILEANKQPNHQTRSRQLHHSFSRNKTGSLNAVRSYRGQAGREQVLAYSKSQLTSSAVQDPCNRRDEVKAVQVAPRYTSNGMVSRRQTSDSQKSQPAQQHILSSSKCSPHESTLKRKHGKQRALREPTANMSEKVKADLRRQEETSRRLSQPTARSTFKTRRARFSRHPSPQKSFQDSSGGVCSSQASNCMPSSSEGPLTSQFTRSEVGSNNVSAGKLLSSSIRGSLGKPEDVDDFVDTRQPLQSMYKNREDLLCGIILQNPDFSESGELENSLCSQNGSTSSAIYTESFQRSSLESSISSDPSLSEFTTSSDERGVDKWKDDHNRLHDIKRHLNVFLTESSSESLSESLTVSLGDTASSHHQSDANSKSFNSDHIYSGRNTAAILQELLTALSSSTSQRKSSDNIEQKAEGTESCSLESDFRQVEKPRISASGYAQYTEDLCSDSTSQDSASSHSSEGSQLSQENEECEMDNSVTSKDCTSIAGIQAEEGYFPETPATGRTEMKHGRSREHADFADCEALLSTISKLHHIDPEVIGLKARAEKHPNEEFIVSVASKEGLSGCLLDSVLLDKPEEQTQQLDLSNSTSFSAEDEADSIYRSDIESSFRSGHDEASIWNKKLVTDCINEAFKSLSKQLYRCSSSLSEHSSATQVLSKVYKQLDEWRGMATSMNLDDMVEKEMNITTRSWRNIGTGTEEVAEVVESTIFSGLLEEVLLELI